jgi:uncharacterized protein with GYD domain
MALFVVKHQHDAETCPAGHPQMGPMLVQHVSHENAAEQFGVDIQGEAVVDGSHTFYLILESDDQANVERFMAPFGQVGTVDILPASRCEAVVARAAC